MSAGKTYSTFIDNAPHRNLVDNEALLSRKSSTTSLQSQKGATTQVSSGGTLHRQYAKPPVIPTTTSPLHNRENFVAGTGSYSSSFFGAMMWRIGATCCPCFGGPSAATGESAGFFQALARQFVKKMSPASNGASEGQQLIKRTKSEEEILKKRPKRKVKSDHKSSEDNVPVDQPNQIAPPSQSQESGHQAQSQEESNLVKNGCSKVPEQKELDVVHNGSTMTKPPRPSPRMVTAEARSKSMSRLAHQNENPDQWSSKSASPSPVIIGDRTNHHGVASSRECRDSSGHSKNSSDHFGIDADSPDASVPRDDSTRYPIQFGKQMQHGGSTISLGSRSESMLSLQSQDGGRYGTVIVCGEVEFSLAYNVLSGSLDIVVKQCRDLAAVDSKRNRSDPYVKVYLLPDKTKSGKRKTKVKKHTLNPVFEEILKFPMSLTEVERRTLWLSVWHSDMFGRNDFLGEVMLPLYGQHLDDPTPKWHCLTDRNELVHKNPCRAISQLGELFIALKFVPPISDYQLTDKKSSSSRRSSSASFKAGSLLVLIREAKNLVAKGGRVPNVLCKCYLLPSNNDSNKRKTSICRKSSNPQWDHTLRWDGITKTDLDNMSLEITVWNHDSVPGRHKECLGGARFNHGTGEHHGKAVFWMDASDNEIHLWQQMLDRPNFWVEGSVLLRSPEKS